MGVGLLEHLRQLDGHALCFIGERPAIYAHRALLEELDRLTEDALGSVRAASLRARAAHAAWSLLLEPLVAQLPSADERIIAGDHLFAACGFGNLEGAYDAEGGLAEGLGLIGPVRAQRPVHAFAAGFLAALGERAFSLEPGALEVAEVGCVAQGDPSCTFELTPTGHTVELRGASLDAALDLLPAPSQREPASPAVFSRVRDALAQFPASDDRCLVPADYFNAIVHRVLSVVEEEKPEVTSVALELLREASRASHRALISALISEELENHDLATRLDAGCAAAAALGVGSLRVVQRDEDRMTLEAPGGPEALYAAVVGTGAPGAACFLLEGAAAAILDLADPGPHLAHEIACVRRGDDRCRVVVERAGS